MRKRKLETEEERRRGGWKGKRREGRESGVTNIDEREEAEEEEMEEMEEENRYRKENGKMHISAYTDNSQVFSVSSQGDVKSTGSLTVSNGTFRIPLTGDVGIDRGVVLKGKLKVAGRLNVIEGVTIGGSSGSVRDIEGGGISVIGRNGFRPLLSLSTVEQSQDETQRRRGKEGEGDFGVDEEGSDCGM